MSRFVNIIVLAILFLRAYSQQTTTTTTTSTSTTTTRPSTTTTTASTTTTTVPSTTTTTTGGTSTTSTTTTTRPSTTTVVGNTSPAADQLWDINFYYNWWFGTHAFCADSACVTAIQSNGIGYDMMFGKGTLGKAVSESAIAAVRASCTSGSQNLRNLGFTKSGRQYIHNLDGSGLKQGWVSTVSGACGATVPIRRWKSRFTDGLRDIVMIFLDIIGCNGTLLHSLIIWPIRKRGVFYRL
ncbi:hypothetical protein PENTCL1PPCAC_4024, partial [Pristionchus entomophagus]